MRPVILLVFLFSCSFVIGLPSCKDVKNKLVPCVEVFPCNKKYSSVTIDNLSNGLGASVSSSRIDICFDESRLYLSHNAFKQTYFPQNKYPNCNDGVFNLDVAEAFIAPIENITLETEGPHCYSELDVSPYNVMFESGIYNPNLNHTGISGTLLDCSTSGVIHETVMMSNSWVSKMSYPWKILNCPSGCSPSSCNTFTPLTYYRANFYRVNELIDVSSSVCSKTSCEYMAWSPTYSNPPSFHEPNYFGYLVLVR